MAPWLYYVRTCSYHYRLAVCFVSQCGERVVDSFLWTSATR